MSESPRFTPRDPIPLEFRQAHSLIDRMYEIPAVNELWCTCGARILPDCDMSSISISNEFERHLIGEGLTQEQLDAWYVLEGL